MEVTLRTFHLAVLVLLVVAGAERILPTLALNDGPTVSTRDDGTAPSSPSGSKTDSIPIPLLLGVDAWFHIRMAQAVAADFPHHLRADGSAFFPMFEDQQVSGLLNVIHAALIRADVQLTGVEPAVSALRTGVWLPVVLALVAIFLVLMLARHLAGLWAALASGVMMILYPGTFLARSVAGFLDQHVLETLLAVATLLGILHVLRQKGSWTAVVVCSLAPVLFLFSWLGAAVYFLHLSVFVFVLFMSSSSTEWPAWGAALGRYFLAAGLWYVALVFVFPSWPMEMVRGIRLAFPPAFWALAVTAWGIGTWATRPGGVNPRARLVLAGSLAAVTVLVLTGIEPARELVLRSFMRQAPDVTEVDVTVGAVWMLFGPSLFLAALGWSVQVFGIRWAARAGAGLAGAVNPAESPAPARAAAFYAFISLLLWLVTEDFDYVPPVFIALYAGIGLVVVWRAIPLPGAAKVVVAGALLILPIWPLGWSQLPFSIEHSRETFVLYDEAWTQAMDWLRTNTPQPARSVNTEIRSRADLEPGLEDYGVMTSWEYGNAVTYLGQRSPTFSRFPSMREPAWFLSQTEQEERSHRCPMCRDGQRVAYAVVGARLAGELYPLGLMRSRGLDHIPEPARGAKAWVKPTGRTGDAPAVDGDLEGGPVFDVQYDQALAVRLVMGTEQIPGIEVVYQSPQQSVLYWEYHPKEDRLYRLTASLEDAQGRSVGINREGIRYYGVDTVHTVQIFRFTN